MNRRAAVALATAAFVATVGGGALATVETGRLADRRSLAADVTLPLGALAAGRQIAVDFLAYDYRHIDADFTRVTNEAVGTLKKDFATQAAGVRGLIVQAKAISTAVVVTSAVVNVSGANARVLVSLNRTVINSSAPKGQTNAVDLHLDLVRQHGRWLAVTVKPL